MEDHIQKIRNKISEKKHIQKAENGVKDDLTAGRQSYLQEQDIKKKHPRRQLTMESTEWNQKEALNMIVQDHWRTSRKRLQRCHETNYKNRKNIIILQMQTIKELREMTHSQEG